MSSHFPPENREDCMIKEDGLPVGLGFGLAMNEKALGQFSMMTEDVKTQVTDDLRPL